MCIVCTCNVVADKPKKVGRAKIRSGELRNVVRFFFFFFSECKNRVPAYTSHAAHERGIFVLTHECCCCSSLSLSLSQRSRCLKAEAFESRSAVLLRFFFLPFSLTLLLSLLCCCCCWLLSRSLALSHSCVVSRCCAGDSQPNWPSDRLSDHFRNSLSAELR